MLRVIYKEKEYKGGVLYAAILAAALGLYSGGAEFPEYNPLNYVYGDCKAE
ncbi:unnamed protein product [marine sediment metagenome]|uniref:Uncharacterized protein n=1 Tax=marine sediment metagenome TaxID=412755 RepID=X0V3C0_9ZZZZ